MILSDKKATFANMNEKQLENIMARREFARNEGLEEGREEVELASISSI